MKLKFINLFRNKSCLNCAFCTHNKDYYVKPPAYSHTFAPFWNNTQRNLTTEELEKTKSSDFSFLGKEKHIQQEWEKEYALRNAKYLSDRDEKPRQVDPFSASSLIDAERMNENLLDITDPYHRYEVLGMSEYPDAPDKDYLSCWHNQWSSKDSADVLSKLQTKKCKFYYPLNKKEDKDFDGCYAEMKTAIDTKRFWITTLLVVVGIIVSLLVYLFQSKQDSNESAKQKKYQDTQTESILKHIDATTVILEKRINIVENTTPKTKNPKE